MPTVSLRRKIEIEGENFYVIIGKSFVDATVPRENSEDNRKLRTIVDKLCDCITEGLTYLSDKEELCPNCALNINGKCSYYVDIVPGTFECDMWEEK